MNLQTSEFNHSQNEEIQVVEVALIVFAREPILRQRFREITPDHLEFIEVSEDSSPSVQDILDSIENSKGKNVILLPNHKDLIEICNQALLLTSKNSSQIPTKNFIEGISKNKNLKIIGVNFKDNKSACLKCFYQSDPSDEVLNCEAEGIIGPIAGIIASIQANEVLKKIISNIDIDQKLISIYAGNNIIMDDAFDLLNQLQLQFPKSEFDLIESGQYDSEYFIGIE